MTSYHNPEPGTTAYCRACGKGLTAEERRTGPDGVIYCADHVPAGAPEAPASPYGPTAAIPPQNAAPVFAFVLGFIPGVGAIYNGQYAKGLVHALIFGLLISLVDGPHTMGPMLAVLIPAFVFYMAFEAYHTARKRMAGEPLDEFSSLFRVRNSSYVSAIVLILLGVMFLLDTLEAIRLSQMLKFWPVLLILAGVNMLYGRISAAARGSELNEGVRHEQ